MSTTPHIFQHPAPGSRTLMFRGDTVTFALELSEPAEGGAWIRTNIGHGELVRRAVIEAVVNDTPGLGQEWFDIPMARETGTRFSVTLPLTEVGHFEAKCFFMPAGRTLPVWPEGPNTEINVGPADTCCANIIYNAFVRQFGPNKDGAGLPDSQDAACIERLDKKAYTVIPRSGTFRDLIAHLDFITGVLGCRIVHLLPIHPTPTTYGRMGRFGSPYAALSFTGVDPALAVFDPKATPLEQFAELVDALHARHARLILDIAVNHTGWAATLHETHPEWLKRDHDGEIQVPGAWGVTWNDLTSLDYSKKELWQYIADMFLTWCRRGVDGFRCDAGYMIPVPAWTFIIAAVRDQYPDTLFFLEGLGGKISVTRDLLNRADFNWAYSELFQNYDRSQIEHYLPETIDISRTDGLTVHFAETHDNNRLAARSAVYAKMRTALCALFSPCGGFGFANGVEWLAPVKINVHEACPLNWGNPENQVDHIRRLNILLRNHPAFFENVEMRVIGQGPGNHAVLLRRHIPSEKQLVVAVNLDDRQAMPCAWNIPPGMTGTDYIDLLTGTPFAVRADGPLHACELTPGQVVCLSTDKNDLELFHQPDNLSFEPRRALDQRIRAKVLELFCRSNGTMNVAGVDLAGLGRRLVQDPGACCRFLNTHGGENRVVRWQWPVDTRREVMVPPGHFLLISAPAPFIATVTEAGASGQKTVGCEKSLPATDGTFFALFTPWAETAAPVRRTLQMAVYEKEKNIHAAGPLLFVRDTAEPLVDTVLTRTDLTGGDHLFLATNGRGGMCRALARWGRLASKYDALLAANLNPDFPEDRRVLFTRCRAWIVFQGYSQEICFDCLDTFAYRGDRGVWTFKVPTGQGQRIDLAITVAMAPGENRTGITFERLPAGRHADMLADPAPVRLILRPDIEDRSFHETTKAFTGPEHAWPAAVTPRADGFVFAPAPDRRLAVTLSGGAFVPEPEWYYMVHRPLEAERGMDPSSDLFSPGYLSIHLNGGQGARLTVAADGAAVPAPAVPALDDSGPRVPADRMAQTALAAYVARREPFLSVIAGYPWFLDWGRDSLIFSRGLIAAGMTDEALAVLRQFGRFEANGTLPNMICGDNAGNRDTSDAPLWFITACADMARREPAADFLSRPCGHRTLADVVRSIGEAYAEGTPNGIRMDKDSGLIFSPAHFTWMDTNFPACTPRQGYCIEIQALWHAALVFLAAIDPSGRHDWKKLADRVKNSIARHFFTRQGYLADCLHATAGEPAAKAGPDDALRPNQLFAITLGAVSNKVTGAAVLEACQALLVPGAIRSLADAPVTRPLEILHSGRRLNDPLHPYKGRYAGDEDTSRKPAYHNGTAWTWIFPSYCEAWVAVYGEAGKTTARALMTGSLELLRTGCVGHFPEILDGDYPHALRGCDAQAWGVSEWLRVWRLLQSPSDF
ncbi:MAG: amylo-alpha-1,6-glucosidase [Thermodesulfobacteriota bacterium]